LPRAARARLKEPEFRAECEAPEAELVLASALIEAQPGRHGIRKQVARSRCHAERVRTWFLRRPGLFARRVHTMRHFCARVCFA
jgi:hypothetical protein